MPWDLIYPLHQTFGTSSIFLPCFFCFLPMAHSRLLFPVSSFPPTLRLNHKVIQTEVRATLKQGLETQECVAVPPRKEPVQNFEVDGHSYLRNAIISALSAWTLYSIDTCLLSLQAGMAMGEKFLEWGGSTQFARTWERCLSTPAFIGYVHHCSLSPLWRRRWEENEVYTDVSLFFFRFPRNNAVVV